MDTKTQTIKQYAAQLRLGGIQDQLDQLIQKASEEQCSYLDFSLYLLQTEITQDPSVTWNAGPKLLNCHPIMILITMIMPFRVG